MGLCLPWREEEGENAHDGSVSKGEATEGMQDCAICADVRLAASFRDQELVSRRLSLRPSLPSLPPSAFPSVPSSCKHFWNTY